MERTRRFLFAVATAAAVIGTSLIGGTAHAESNGGVRVMPLGDSITDGITVAGAYRIDLWKKFVADGYKVDFVGSLSNGPSSLGDHDHEGHSGWRIDQIDANIVNWLNTYKPRTILLHIGTNDMYQNPNGAPDRLGTLLDHITTTAPNAEVFVATIIPMPSSASAVQRFNAAVPGVVQKRVSVGKHVHLVDMAPALTSSDLADGVHPNAGGYSKMATVWYKALQSVPGSLSDGTSPTPTTSMTQTLTPSKTPTKTPGGDGACTATFRKVNSWNSGFQAEITVRNNGTTALTGWSVNLALPEGQSISNIWGGVSTGTTGDVTIRSNASSAALPGMGSTAVGLIINGTGTDVPSSLTCMAA
jgi:lysophospholipase L1-like esterase